MTAANESIWDRMLGAGSEMPALPPLPPAAGKTSPSDMLVALPTTDDVSTLLATLNQPVERIAGDAGPASPVLAADAWQLPAMLLTASGSPVVPVPPVPGVPHCQETPTKAPQLGSAVAEGLEPRALFHQTAAGPVMPIPLPEAVSTSTASDTTLPSAVLPPSLKSRRRTVKGEADVADKPPLDAAAREAKAEKSRQSARNCRKRKKAYIECLETECAAGAERERRRLEQIASLSATLAKLQTELQLLKTERGVCTPADVESAAQAQARADEAAAAASAASASSTPQ